MKVYVHCPPLTSMANSMGLYVQTLARTFKSQGFETVICSIACKPAGFAHLVVPEPLRTRVSRLNALMLYARLSLALLGEKDFVILNISHEFVLPAFRSRSLTIVHDTIQTEYPRSRGAQLLSTLWWRDVGKSAIRISVSHATQRDLKKMGIESEVVYNFFDAEAFSAPGSTPPAPLADALWCGTLAPHKNFALFVALCLRHPDKRFRAVLPPADAASLKGALPANLAILSGLSQEAYAAEVRSAAIMISTSLKEGYGRPPMEALMAGTPVLLSDIDVYREVYGTTARFFAPEIDALDTAFQMMWDDVRAGRVQCVPLERLKQHQGDPASVVMLTRTLLERSK